VRLRSSTKRSSATLAATAMMFAGLTAVAIQPASAAPQVTEFHSDVTGAVVPAGVNFLTIELHGGAGGAGGQTGGSGGRGAVQKIQLPVQPGQSFDISVGAHGANGDLNGTSHGAGGGSSLPGAGGPGGDGYLINPAVYGAGGGGGGGATSVVLDGDLLAVAGGGGGGGGTNSNTTPGGNGGNADANGQNGSDVSNATGGKHGDAPNQDGGIGESATPTSAIAGGGAGGGGGGYEGGSGGAFTADTPSLINGSSGAGGGGGDSYFDDAKATRTSLTATEAGAGYVAFTYSVISPTKITFNSGGNDDTVNREMHGYSVNVAPTQPSQAQPTGNVTIVAKSQNTGEVINLGSDAVDSNGDATVFSNKLYVDNVVPGQGQWTLTATYTPDAASQFDSLGSKETESAYVSRGDTDTLLSSDSVDIPNYGDDVNFNVSVLPEAPASGQPTGKVQYFVDGSPVGPTVSNGPITLNSAGNGTLTVHNLSVGVHSITATYLGDREFNQSSSNESELSNFAINQGDTTVTLSIPDGNSLPDLSHNPILSGEDALLDVQVKSNNKGKLKAGTPVQLFDNGVLVDEAAIDYKGFVEFRESDLSTNDHGHHHFQALYNPEGEGSDPNFHQAYSNFQDVVVNYGEAKVDLTVDHNPQRVGQDVTFTIKVTGTDPTSKYDPEGDVQLYTADNTPLDGPITLVNGVATFTTADLPVGANTLYAVYKGDKHYKAGPSNTLLENITPQLTAIELSASVAPDLQYAQNETLTARVTAESVPAHGTVTFLDNGKAILDSNGKQIGKNIVVDANGIARFSTRSFRIGQHQFGAHFTGDKDSQSGASNTLAVKVLPNTVRVAISTDRIPAYTGDKILIHARVLKVGTSKGSITGFLQYYDGSTKLGGAVRVSGSYWGTKSVLAKSLSVGKHRLVARFIPSSDPSYHLKVYSGSTSDQLIQIRRTGSANARIAATVKRTSVDTATIKTHVVKKSGGDASGYVNVYLDGVFVKKLHLDSDGYATGDLTNVADRELAVTVAYLGSGRTKPVSIGKFLYAY